MSHRQPEQPVFPPPTHPAWIAFYDGYLAGITDGIAIGRAQVAQEYTDADTFPSQAPTASRYNALSWAREGLSRHEWIARQKAERAQRERELYDLRDRHGPPLTGDQLREKAYQSWNSPAHSHRFAA